MASAVAIRGFGNPAKDIAQLRITISSPDGLGDFVLRMPLVEALLSAGHRVQLVMRPLAADLAGDLFPEVEVLVLEHDPFHGQTKRLRKPFRREIAEIRRFAPDLYVAGAFQLNYFDEILLEGRSLQFRVAGFEAEEEFWPSDTSVDPRELARNFEVRVRVPSTMPEGEKNLCLAAAVLGADHQVEQTAARQPTAASLTAARTLLAAHGIQEREFVVVCAGSRPGLIMKDWGEPNWAELLKQIGQDEPRALVFLGNPKEAASVERLRAALPPCAKHMCLADNPPPVPVSYALVSMAAAYLGRDSGVMHLAAAAGVPLLALFTGAHWPRFLPAAKRGIVLTRATPCRGCGYFCPFTERWCVTTIPREAVVREWARLPEVGNLEVVELDSGEKWMAAAAEHDVPAYAREQLVASRCAAARLKNHGFWRKLVRGLNAS